MKKLEKKITGIVTRALAEPRLATDLHAEPGAPLEAGALDIISDIMKAIGEYFHEVEEAACYLLEVWPLPNNTVAIKSKVTENCTLVYSISKE